ncbi:MAG: thiamine biosynthesis protein ThiF [Chloroflexota bacterium]
MVKMPVYVYIGTPLRRFTGNQARVQVEARDVAEALDRLAAQFPELKAELFDETGQLRRYVNVYVNNQEIEDLAGPNTAVRDGDEIAVVPALAGGAPPRTLTPEQVIRYSRHMIMPEIGGTGQRKLLGSSVLVIGAGGLGSPAILYLAAAGVGRIGVVDFDVVDLSNLQRQIIHHTDDIGRPKVESARDTVRRINPDVEVVPYNTALTSANALEIIKDYEVVVNGCDNFPTRYLVNDACVFLKKPLVDASVFKFDAQVTVFMPGHGCYRCLYPAPPPPGAVPNCAEAGVFGVVTGLVGAIQATEAIKLILGLGEPLVGRLLLIDTLAMDFRTVKLRRNPNCPVCGDNPTITELIDYEAFCGVPVLAQS